VNLIFEPNRRKFPLKCQIQKFRYNHKAAGGPFDSGICWGACGSRMQMLESDH